MQQPKQSKESQVSKPETPIKEQKKAEPTKEPETAPKLPAVKVEKPKPAVEPVVGPAITLEPAQEPSPRELQAIAMSAKPEEHNLINVRLSLSELENYDEKLPESIVRALLDPDVPDFFIPIQAPGRRLHRCKGHYLHTAFIRELILLDELPERGK